MPNPGSDGVDGPLSDVVGDERAGVVVPVGVDGGHVAVGVFVAVAVLAVGVALDDRPGVSVAVETGTVVGDRVCVSVVFVGGGEGVDDVREVGVGDRVDVGVGVGDGVGEGVSVGVAEAVSVGVGEGVGVGDGLAVGVRMAVGVGDGASTVTVDAAVSFSTSSVPGLTPDPSTSIVYSPEALEAIRTVYSTVLLPPLNQTHWFLPPR
jgi:hypothetical protein